MQHTNTSKQREKHAYTPAVEKQKPDIAKVEQQEQKVAKR